MQTTWCHLATLAAAAILGSALIGGPARADEPAKARPTVSRTGISYRPADERAGPPDLVNAIRSRRPGGKLWNLDRMLLNSPPFAKGWNGMFAAIRGQLSLQPRLREIAIMAIATLNKAEYEWAAHEPELLAAGGTRAQLAALRDVPAAMKDGKLFDEAERATLALTVEMTRDIVVSEATMKRIRAVLDDQKLVELIGTIAGYNMVSRFLVATGLDLE